jgi:FKBP-type peptidyl-prolyl cis-trans isomerase
MVAFLLAMVVGAIPASEAAAIEREQEKNQTEVNEKYGNRKPSEMTGDERRDMMKDQAEADQKVLDKHNVDQKEWASSQSHRSRDERAEVKAEKAKQADKEKEKAKADAEAKKKAAAEPNKPIQIQRGISDENPVVLEEKPGAGPIIERGLPADAKADQEAANGTAGDGAGKSADEKPAKSGHGK